MNPSRLTQYVWSALVSTVVAVIVASCSSPVLSGADASLPDTGPVRRADAHAVVSCKGGTTDCSGACVTTSSDVDHCGSCDKACGPGEVCSEGSCGLYCSGGTTKCGSSCAVTDTDVNNCGACGKQCAKGEACTKGKCGVSCGAGTTMCGASCVDEQVDPANCGACGKVCGATDGGATSADGSAPADGGSGMLCSRGVCALACGSGTSPCGALCVDEQVDPANCGACGKSCGVGVACSAAACATTCSAGLTLCAPSSVDAGTLDATLAVDAGGNNGGCVDVLTDRDHCGICARVCAGGEICTNGDCVVSCPAGEINCGGACVDPKTDNQHCGAKGTCAADGGSLGKVCAAGTVCAAGACTTTCASSESLCPRDGGGLYCANEKTDNANCGACGKTCPAGEVCSNSTCAAGCAAPDTECTPDGGVAHCVDEQTDDDNCGACDKKCPAGEACFAGKCKVTCRPAETLCLRDGGVGYCANFLTDNANCNGCGVTCPNGEACAAGACVLGCQAPQTLCVPHARVPDAGSSSSSSSESSESSSASLSSSSSVSASSDPSSSSSSASSSSSSALVSSSAESSSAAASSSASGPEDAGAPYCADFSNDSNNCNGCGNVCPAGQSCVGAACVVVCQAPQSLCTPGSSPDASAWYCADFQTDSNNCNGCGNVCPAGEACSGASCGAPACTGAECVVSYPLPMAAFSVADETCYPSPDFYYVPYDSATITWQDTLPGGSTILAAEVVFNWGLNCNGTINASLNATGFGPPTEPAALPCICPSGGPLASQTDLPVGAYLVGAVNTMTVGANVDLGFATDANGVAATVVVTYSLP